MSYFTSLSVVVALMLMMGRCADAQEPASPINYRLHFNLRAEHKLVVECKIPTNGKPFIELMMPIWSPGFYRVENYVNRVEQFTARLPNGITLPFDQPRKNRWRVKTNGAAHVLVAYRLLCNSRSVTLNWVGNDCAVINGPATFITLADSPCRPHEVSLDLPRDWPQSKSGLPTIGNAQTLRYSATDYDTLVDSPIVAGHLQMSDFVVSGCTNSLVALGDVSQWDKKRITADLQKLIEAHHRFWGQLPFKRYVFLIVLSPGVGGSGLEHKDSTLIMVNPDAPRPNRKSLMWLSLVSHEYFHAQNVKRLRPIELGPFDYEKEPRTKSLWVSEGLTSYFGDLVLHRSGLSRQDEFLGQMTGLISQLQSSPGRFEQTLEDASSDVWTTSFSGMGGSNKSVSYYIKGAVVGILLDAHIRRLTKNRKSLDDVMRLASERYSGEKGFTPDQFRKTAEEVAGYDLERWFRRALSSKDELDYSEFLNWYGLQFTTPDPAKSDRKWKLTVRPKATAEQKENLKLWLTGGKAEGS